MDDSILAARAELLSLHFNKLWKRSYGTEISERIRMKKKPNWARGLTPEQESVLCALAINSPFIAEDLSDEEFAEAMKDFRKWADRYAEARKRD